jgi:MAF protein
MSFPDLILASNSPRRREMLAWLGIPFSVMPSAIDESQHPSETPETYVRRLSAEKCTSISKSTPSGTLVLAADTIVVDGNEVLGKPLDSEDAERMLLQLRGKYHRVMTALTLTLSGKTTHELCSSPVWMRCYNDDELREYVQSKDPLDKAGAYAIQSPSFHPVENFNHCFTSVMGLPLCHLDLALTSLIGSHTMDIAVICQQHTGYRCPIFRQVLNQSITGYNEAYG